MFFIDLIKRWYARVVRFIRQSTETTYDIGCQQFTSAHNDLSHLKNKLVTLWTIDENEPVAIKVAGIISKAFTTVALICVTSVVVTAKIGFGSICIVVSLNKFKELGQLLYNFASTLVRGTWNVICVYTSDFARVVYNTVNYIVTHAVDLTCRTLAALVRRFDMIVSFICGYLEHVLQYAQRLLVDVVATIWAIMCVIVLAVVRFVLALVFRTYLYEIIEFPFSVLRCCLCFVAGMERVWIILHTGDTNVYTTPTWTNRLDASLLIWMVLFQDARDVYRRDTTNAH